jgi:hypothetical protein
MTSILVIAGANHWNLELGYSDVWGIQSCGDIPGESRKKWLSTLQIIPR